MNTHEIPAILAGNLIRDPELRWTAEGKPVAGLSVAVTARRYDQATQQWTDGATTYADCSAWGPLAEHVADSLRKGDRVIVLGRWTQRSYVVDGTERRKLEVVVDEIGPSLRWAVAKPAKSSSLPSLHEAVKEPPL
jgi:single-strand DNA-binding protein